MSKRQRSLIIALASVALVIAVGGGYYVLRDSGIIGSTSNTTPTGSEGAQPEPTSTSAGSSVDLPPAWTPTPFGFSEIDVAQWGLQLPDFPLGFEKEPMDETGIPPGLANGIEDATLVKRFAFSEEGDSPQLLIGFTLYIPSKSGQAKFDELISNPEFIVDDILSSFDHNGILEQDEIYGLEGIGDYSYGLTCVLDMEAVEMRVDGLGFRRDIAGALLFVLHIDGYPLEISVQDLAEILDQRIIPTLPSNP
ncbi:MAG: hypothetical protein P8Z41_07725 [Anaerolineales bacterium]|jgi:hypothetical protein